MLVLNNGASDIDLNTCTLGEFVEFIQPVGYEVGEGYIDKLEEDAEPDSGWFIRFDNEETGQDIKVSYENYSKETKKVADCSVKKIEFDNIDGHGNIGNGLSFINGRVTSTMINEEDIESVKTAFELIGGELHEADMKHSNISVFYTLEVDPDSGNKNIIEIEYRESKFSAISIEVDGSPKSYSW